LYDNRGRSWFQDRLGREWSGEQYFSRTSVDSAFQRLKPYLIQVPHGTVETVPYKDSRVATQAEACATNAFSLALIRRGE
jgi:hypothetical protein